MEIDVSSLFGSVQAGEPIMRQGTSLIRTSSRPHPLAAPGPASHAAGAIPGAGLVIDDGRAEP